MFYFHTFVLAEFKEKKILQSKQQLFRGILLALVVGGELAGV